VNNSVLIVEDEFIEANTLEEILVKAGYTVTGIARSVSTALNMIEKRRPGIVMLDIQLQGNLTGIDLGVKLREMKIAFLYLSANSNKSILDAAKATKPYGFLVKPFRSKDVLIMLDIALYLHKHAVETLKGTDTGGNGTGLPARQPLKEIVGSSPAMADIINHIQVVSQADTAVLILGESGTGKELVAQAIHHLSSRRNKALVVVNCGALPANLIESELFGHEKGSFTGALNKRIGKFEQADGGTRRASDRSASEVSACPARERDRKDRGKHTKNRCTHHCCHEQKPGRGDQQGSLSIGSLLPLEYFSYFASPAAGETKRHPASG